MFWYRGQLREGETLNLGVTEPALIYGATVFTTMRVYEQSLEHPLTHWHSHCQRLIHSLEVFGWVLPDWERIQQGAQILLKHNPVLRITIFPDGGELITGRGLPPDLVQRQQQGVTGWVAGSSLFQRCLGQHKTGNYLGAWLALQRAQQLGAKEAILVTQGGNWLETSTGNLWGYKNEFWYTPSLNGAILPGVGRSHLVQWLQRLGLPVVENQWTPEFVEDLEIIAYSNSVVEIVPFCRILSEDIEVNFASNSKTLDELREYFKT